MNQSNMNHFYTRLMKTVKVEIPEDYYTNLEINQETAKKTALDLAIVQSQNRLNKKGYKE